VSPYAEKEKARETHDDRRSGKALISSEGSKTRSKDCPTARLEEVGENKEGAAVMTPKRVLTVDFGEIENIEVRCNCGTTVTIPIPLPKTKPSTDFNCPGCNKRLWGDETQHTYVRVAKLMELIGDWSDKERPNEPKEKREFVLGFSITEPS
jgi:hypothetical protein